MKDLTNKELLAEVMFICHIINKPDYSINLLKEWVKYASRKLSDDEVMKVLAKSYFILGDMLCRGKLCAEIIQSDLLNLYRKNNILDPEGG